MVSQYNSFSLLDPNSRIIQKIKVFDINNIITEDRKKANQIALNYYIDSKIPDITDSFFRSIVTDWNGFMTDERKKWLIDNLSIFKLNQNKYKNDALMNFAKSSFRGYIFEQNESNRFIYAENNIDDKVLIELDNRYCKSYQDKINRRAKFLGWRYRKSKSVLLTLTIDPKLYDYDKYLMWVDIKKQLNRFLTNVKYYFKKSNRKFPPYICSIEAQKNGNPHLHILFLGASRLLDWRKIRDIWKLGHIFINRDSNNRRIRNPVNYLMKYISKTYTDTNEKNELTQALCWLFNIRSYQCSRGLITPLKKSRGYTGFLSKYLVIVDDTIPVNFLKENIGLIGNLSYKNRCVI